MHFAYEVLFAPYELIHKLVDKNDFKKICSVLVRKLAGLQSEIPIFRAVLMWSPPRFRSSRGICIWLPFFIIYKPTILSFTLSSSILQALINNWKYRSSCTWEQASEIGIVFSSLFCFPCSPNQTLPEAFTFLVPFSSIKIYSLTDYILQNVTLQNHFFRRDQNHLERFLSC